MAEPEQTEIRRRPLTRLSGDAMDYLRAGGKEATYEDGAAVVTVGEPRRAFYVVVDGEVDVVLKDGSGRRLHPARLHQGPSPGRRVHLLGLEGRDGDLRALPAHVPGPSLVAGRVG